MLTAERIRQLLDYDPATGEFRWRESEGKKRQGELAGKERSPGGYARIGIDYERYYSHRLAWFYIYGEWPKEVDHANGIKSDNRLSNLRLATHSQNLANTRRRSDNKSGFKGVRYCERLKRWCAVVKKDGKATYLGSFLSPETAHEAYAAAALRVHGKFANSGRESRNV